MDTDKTQTLQRSLRNKEAFAGGQNPKAHIHALLTNSPAVQRQGSFHRACPATVPQAARSVSHRQVLSLPVQVCHRRLELLGVEQDVDVGIGAAAVGVESPSGVPSAHALLFRGRIFEEFSRRVAKDGGRCGVFNPVLPSLHSCIALLNSCPGAGCSAIRSVLNKNVLAKAGHDGHVQR